MAYLPKSQISIKHTVGGFLVYKNTKKPFSGDYILTSTGNYYKGTNNIDLGSELIPFVNESLEHENRRGHTKDVKKHVIFKGKIDNFLKKTKPLPFEKPIPTEQEYKDGFFSRNFAKKINAELYIEISNDTLKLLNSRDPKHDYNLYEGGSLIWHLRGNVFKKNALSIKKTQIVYKQINSLFPILNEYKIPEATVRNNLHTNGGELGPMVGPIHTEGPHPKLYYSDQLPNINGISYEDFLKTNLKKEKGPAYRNPKKVKKGIGRLHKSTNIKKYISQSPQRKITPAKKRGS